MIQIADNEDSKDRDYIATPTSRIYGQPSSTDYSTFSDLLETEVSDNSQGIS